MRVAQTVASRAARRLSLLVLGTLLALSPRAGAFNAGLAPPPTELDRASPWATVQGFFNEMRSGHPDLAAQYLWLDDVPVAQQPSVGVLVARRLRSVFNRHPIDFATLPKDADASAPAIVLAVLDVDGKPLPVRLVRVRADDAQVWLFSRDTVRAVTQLDEGYDPPFGERLPHFLFASRLGLELWQWLGLLIGLAAALLVGWFGDRVLVAVVGRLTRRTEAHWDDDLVRALRGPLTIFLGIGVLQVVEDRLLLSPGWERALGLICRSLGIVATAWFALRLVDVSESAVSRKLDARGGSAAAGRRTHLAVLWRVLNGVIVLIALATLLMQFNVVRTVGLSLLASAGVAGVVLGLAAQKSIGALFAGVQVSITQPIRLGDQVVVEGESGVVAKMSLTSVVIRTWDNRHLLLPVTYFLEKPFQNWTREDVDILGTVLLHLDYRVDVAVLRQELARILAGPGKALWNGRVALVQVTEASEQTATIRIVASAAVGSVMDLRCLVREEFLKFLRDRPEWLPMQRQEHRPGEPS